MLFLVQICITTSTSAGLDQILPWMLYHKVIGVTTFFLFVEGKAASPSVIKVLESIPVSSCILCRTFSTLIYVIFAVAMIINSLSFSQGVKVILRTRELEEQQAKRSVAFPY